MLLDMAMDEQRELERVQNPKERQKKFSRYSNSLFDSGHALANIRGHDLIKMKLEHDKKIRKVKNLDNYLTYNAINMASQNNENSEKSNEKSAKKNSKSLPPDSGSITTSCK